MKHFMLALIVLLLSACSRSAAPSPFTQLTGALQIEAPRLAHVGYPLTVTLRSEQAALDGTPAVLLISTGVSEQVMRGAFVDGLAVVTIPAEQMTHAGAMTLIARSGAAHGSHSLYVRPDRAESPLLLLVGPRSVVVGQNQHNMAVVVANDRFGNPLTNGVVELRARYSEDDVRLEQPRLHRLVAWQWLESTLVAGRVSLAARLGDASSPENSVEAVAGALQPFTISASPSTAEADGRQLVRLSTSAIHDAAGNVVPDGLYVEFVVESSAGENIRRIPTVTINGVAEAALQAPLETDTLVIRAILSDVESAALRVLFENASLSAQPPLTVAIDASGQALRLTFGPITGALGQLVADGTPVRFSLTDPLGNREWIEASAEGGYAAIDVRMLTLRVGNYTLEAFSGIVRAKTTFYVPA